MAKPQIIKNKKEQQAEKIATPAEDSNEKLIHLIIFRIGSEEYGIRIEQVKEVTVTPTISRVPQTPHFIKGIANIRGDIIALMDLEDRFNLMMQGLAPIEELDNSYTLVIDTDQFTLGLLVREVPQSLTVGVSKIDTTPGLIKDSATMDSGFIDGIAKVGGRLIIILDMEKILRTEEVSFLQTEVQ